MWKSQYPLYALPNETLRATGVAGVLMKSGVVLTPSMLTYLAALRPRLDFDIIVTSGLRSVSDQASAMLTKFQMGGITELYATYSNDAEIMRMVNEYGSSLEGFRQAIQDQVNRGVYMSRHMRGDGLDFRVRDLTQAQQTKLSVAALAAGATKVLAEGVPPHLHVDGFANPIAFLPTLTRTQMVLGAAGGAGAGGLVLFLAWRWWWRSR